MGGTHVAGINPFNGLVQDQICGLITCFQDTYIYTAIRCHHQNSTWISIAEDYDLGNMIAPELLESQLQPSSMILTQSNEQISEYLTVNVSSDRLALIGHTALAPSLARGPQNREIHGLLFHCRPQAGLLCFLILCVYYVYACISEELRGRTHIQAGDHVTTPTWRYTQKNMIIPNKVR